MLKTPPEEPNISEKAKEGNKYRKGNMSILALHQKQSQYHYCYLSIDFNCCNVCGLIHILYSGIVHVSIGQFDTNPTLVGYNMGIGHYETISTDDEARTIRNRDLTAREWMPVKK